jgi:hypothetical protein
MSMISLDDQKVDAATLARLTQSGPVIVTHQGQPVFVAHQAAPEWLEAWAAEQEMTGSLTLREYAELYKISLDPEAYRAEFPDDAPFTQPAHE